MKKSDLGSQQHNVMKSNFPLSLKIQVYVQCILPVLPYSKCPKGEWRE